MSDSTKNMTNKAEILNYEIVESLDGEPKSQWQIWTPDEQSGAVIGFGNTRDEAIKSTIANLALTISGLTLELPHLPSPAKCSSIDDR